MLKKLVNKRIETFKKEFPDYQISKKGNLYYKYNVSNSNIVRRYSGFSVTKGTYGKIGESNIYTKKVSEAIFLIKPDTGKMLIATRNWSRTVNYKLITLKDVRNYTMLASTFFIGRKFEYLKDYPNLWAFPLAQNFTSLNELKNFLGFTFISDKEFYSIFKGQSYDYIMLFHYAKKKVNVYRLLKNSKDHSSLFHCFEDYLELCERKGAPVIVPAGFNKLKKLHDDLVFELNEEELKKADPNIHYRLKYVPPKDGKTFFLDAWDEMGLKYKKLESQYDMCLQGLKQKHCIGTNYSTELDRYTFYTITFEENEYDLQIYPMGTIVQFYGKRNKQPPAILAKQIRDSNISYDHKIELISTEKPKLKNVQYLAPVNGGLPF